MAHHPPHPLRGGRIHFHAHCSATYHHTHAVTVLPITTVSFWLLRTLQRFSPILHLEQFFSFRTFIPLHTHTQTLPLPLPHYHTCPGCRPPTPTWPFCIPDTHTAAATARTCAQTAYPPPPPPPCTTMPHGLHAHTFGQSILALSNLTPSPHAAHCTYMPIIYHYHSFHTLPHTYYTFVFTFTTTPHTFLTHPFPHAATFFPTLYPTHTLHLLACLAFACAHTPFHTALPRTHTRILHTG